MFSIHLQFGREVLDIAAAHVKPGVTADEIDRIVHEVSMIAPLHIHLHLHIHTHTITQTEVMSFSLSTL